MSGRSRARDNGPIKERGPGLIWREGGREGALMSGYAAFKAERSIAMQTVAVWRGFVQWTGDKRNAFHMQ